MEDGASSVTGVMILVGTTAVLAVSLYFVAGGIADDAAIAPAMSMAQGASKAEYIVIEISQSVFWNEVTVNGCDAPASGPIEGGQRLTNCAGRISIIHNETGVQIWQGMGT